MSSSPPGKTSRKSHKTGSVTAKARAAQVTSHAEAEEWGAVKPRTMESCLASVQLHAPASPPNEQRELAEKLHADALKNAVFQRDMERRYKALPEVFRPIDQGRQPTEEERRRGFRFVNTRWNLVRRWPWIVAWEGGGVDLVIPPWKLFNRSHETHEAIARCLEYCMKNHGHLPLFSPVCGSTSYGHSSDPADLPALSIVSGDWIPEGIMKKYLIARCGEVLAFVFNFNGQPMDEIRRLIVAPTPQKVAEAYAIATSRKFLKEKLVERELAEPDLTEDRLSDTDAAIARAIRMSPGITGKIISERVHVSSENVRKRLGKGTALHRLGFRNLPGRKGYYPPAQPMG